MTKIFISHSHKDDDLTDKVVRDLRRAGADVWVDKSNLHDGNWLQRIDEALQQAEWIVLILTTNALQSTAVIHEVSIGISRFWNKQMKGVIPFVMSSINKSELPPTWDILQRFDAIQEGYDTAFAKLLRALGLQMQGENIQEQNATINSSPSPLNNDQLWNIIENKIEIFLPERYKSLGFRPFITLDGTPYILPPMVRVPTGPFWMGSDDAHGEEKLNGEYRNNIRIKSFEIGLYPVTVAEFACAIASGAIEIPNPNRNANMFGRILLMAAIATGAGKSFLESIARSPYWKDQISRLDHPVVNLSWNSCMEYIKWLRKVSGDQRWRLPTEAEWEKTARWDEANQHSRIYPWGDNWDPRKANTDDGGARMTTPVGHYSLAGDASPYGCHDMAGNVFEWTSSIWFNDTYQFDSTHEDDNDVIHQRVVRGGSFSAFPVFARAAFRGNRVSKDIIGDGGFRLAH